MTGPHVTCAMAAHHSPKPSFDAISLDGVAVFLGHRVTDAGHAVIFDAFSPSMRMKAPDARTPARAARKSARDRIVVMERGVWCPVCAMLDADASSRAAQCRSGRQTLATLGPAACQNVAACSCCHARTETVAACAHQFRRLICTFRCHVISTAPAATLNNVFAWRAFWPERLQNKLSPDVEPNRGAAYAAGRVQSQCDWHISSHNCAPSTIARPVHWNVRQKCDPITPRHVKCL